MKIISAVLKLPKAVPQIIERCSVIILRIEGNSYFPNPSPSLLTVQADVEALRTAEIEMKNGTGSLQARNSALSVVKNDMILLLYYVQGIANANPTQAASIIENAGFYIKKEGGGLSPFTYKITSQAAGQVTLTAPKPEKQYPIVWECSHNREVWTFIAFSRKANCKVNGLPSGELLFFRYSVIGKNNTRGAYSAEMNCRVK